MSEIYTLISKLISVYRSGLPAAEREKTANNILSSWKLDMNRRNRIYG